MKIKPIPGGPPQPEVKYPLPQHHFLLMLSAAKGKGKTTVIINMVKFYSGYFHQVWICSPTVANDPKWKWLLKQQVLAENPYKRQLGNLQGGGGVGGAGRGGLTIVRNAPSNTREPVQKREVAYDGRIPKEHIMESLDDILPKLKEQNDKISALEDQFGQDAGIRMADRILVILDDQAGTFPQGKNNPISAFVFKHRHYNTSVMIATQQYHKVPKDIRANSDALIAYSTGGKEMEDIYVDWTMDLPKKYWISLYNFATKNKAHSFIYFNRTLPMGEQIWVNFDEPIQPVLTYDYPKPSGDMGHYQQDAHTGGHSE